MKPIYFLLFLFFSFCLFAQQEVKVMIDHFPPFSMGTIDKPKGFDIDLINAIAKENKWNLKFIHTDTVKDIINKVNNGEGDIGISGITITNDRFNKVDFSHPYYDSGLQLLVNKNEISSNASFKDKFNKIYPVLGTALLVLLFVLTLSSHAIWVFERFNGDEINFSSNYFKGIGQAYWWSIVTATTVGYGDITPKKIIGRIIAAIIMIVGIMWFGYFTGTMSSIITILSTEKENTSLENYSGKSIGTKSGSTAEKYLQLYSNVKIKQYTNIEKACKDASDGNIAGVFFDKPALVRFANCNSNVKLVGEVLEPQKYGIVVSHNSPLRKQISASILKFKEDGRYQKIYDRWF